MRKEAIEIIGLCFIIGCIIISYGIIHVKQPAQTIRVVGLATRSFDSDLVKWNIVMTRTVGMDGLKSGYTQIAGDLAALKNHFTTNGIAEKDINIQPVNSRPVFDNMGVQHSFTLEQNVFIISSNMALIEKLALNPSFFAERGIALQASTLDYYNSKLADIKKQLLGEATTDALNRAKEIATGAHRRVGKIKSARAGIFQITEPYSTDVSDYGIYRTNTRKKDIKVTLTAEFDIR